ncbi:LCR-like protein [Medicago truncatula]|uniref:LCR-like protein n=1 Tax=Medicago truncatula TaxID=3880 RepID=G7KL17_MEDTR|nr:LCR-like protein [Medicago truncatula]
MAKHISQYCLLAILCIALVLASGLSFCHSHTYCDSEDNCDARCRDLNYARGRCIGLLCCCELL